MPASVAVVRQVAFEGRKACCFMHGVWGGMELLAAHSCCWGLRSEQLRAGFRVDNSSLLRPKHRHTLKQVSPCLNSVWLGAVAGAGLALSLGSLGA